MNADQTAANDPKTALPPRTEPGQGAELSKTLKAHPCALFDHIDRTPRDLRQNQSRDDGGRDSAFDSARALRACLHCRRLFAPKRLKTGPSNKNAYCCRACAAHAPRPKPHFRTPDSTKAERVRANGLINKRLKLGHIARPSNCVRCGKTCKPDSHHPDYQEPDLIAWVCRSCHMLCHNRPEIEREVASLARRARKAVTR